ncbi:MAG: bis(5'-nucleosyl)-tetraphosphatase (symmetrical) YqeK [Pleurocapsa sp.]
MRDRVLTWLEKNVSPQRIRHIVGVEETSIKLAHYHQVDVDKAAQAALMHDLAKFFPAKKLLTMAEAAGICIDSICAKYPHLLHAEVGAIVARQEFGVKDPEILAAISNHTLGSPNMSPLSCVVFIADVLEPSRGDNPELAAMRKLSTKNLYKCLQQTSDYSLKYLVSRQKIIHPRTILTRNWALTKASAQN